MMSIFTKIFTKIFTMCAALCVFTGASATVFAHGLMPMGLLPYWDGDEIVAAATNLGVIFKEDGKFLWRSDLDVEPEVYWNGFRDDGIPLIGTAKGLMVTEDRGCNWRFLDELSGEAVTAYVTKPFVSHAHLVGTGTAEKNNFIYRKSSEASWLRVDSSEVAGVYKGIQYATTSNKYVALSELTDGGYQLHVADESAQEWSSQNVSLGLESNFVRLLGIGDEAGEYALIAAWVERVDDEPGTKGDDHLFKVHLITGDKIALGSIGPHAKFLSGAGQHPSGIFATDSEDAIHRYDGSELVKIENEIRHCVSDKLIEGKLVACGERPQTHAFFVSADGAQWEGILPFSDIELDPCPEDNSGANGSQGSGSGSDSKKASGGCSNFGGGVMSWLLLSGLAIRRRRPDLRN